MGNNKLIYLLASVVSVIWFGSHVAEWIKPNYHVPAGVQAAMMSIITALFAKPTLCRILAKGKNEDACKD